MIPAGAAYPGVYCIRHQLSGRVYVGSSTNIRKRWLAHIRDLNRGVSRCPKLQRSWTKYGQEAFSFSVLESVLFLEDLLGREQHWIDQLHAACPRRGLNAASIAGSQLGLKRSAESRARMSAAALARSSESHQSPNRRGKRPWNKGQRLSAEYRAKISAAQKGKKRRPHSPETIEKLRIAAKRRGMPLETIALGRAALARRVQAREEMRCI